MLFQNFKFVPIFAGNCRRVFWSEYSNIFPLFPLLQGTVGRFSGVVGTYRICSGMIILIFRSTFDLGKFEPEL